MKTRLDAEDVALAARVVGFRTHVLGREVRLTDVDGTSVGRIDVGGGGRVYHVEDAGVQRDIESIVAEYEADANEDAMFEGSA